MAALSEEELKKVFSRIVKALLTIFGPDIVFLTLSKVSTLSLSADGTVTKVSGDPVKVLEAITNEFTSLSGPFIKENINHLLVGYPTLKVS